MLIHPPTHPPTQVGHGLQPGVQVGPLINMGGLQKVQRHVADAVKKGAKVLTGKKPSTHHPPTHPPNPPTHPPISSSSSSFHQPTHPPYPRTGGDLHPLGGTFYEPTVLGNCTTNMLVFQEETFGPVCSVFKFGEEKEALAMANDTPFGTSSSLSSLISPPPPPPLYKTHRPTNLSTQQVSPRTSLRATWVVCGVWEKGWRLGWWV